MHRFRFLACFLLCLSIAIPSDVESVAQESADCYQACVAGYWGFDYRGTVFCGWAKWQEEARKDWDASPITFSRLAMEVWDVIKDEDWVLTANELKHQVRKLWDFDRPYRHPGVELGTSTQIGISLGVALAHRDKKRIVVDIQPDGDLMFDAGALWIAAKYEIPMLVVMHNNRAYYNDWAHQLRMAQLRGTDEARSEANSLFVGDVRK